MAKPLLADELWKRIEPLLPPEPPKPKGGRPRVPNRQALTGILFVSRTGCAWEFLPQELGSGSGMTCWRRLRDWQVAGVWKKVWQVLLDELGLADAIDWSKVVFDSCSVRAFLGGEDWPQSHRSRQERFETSCGQRRLRDTAGARPNWRESA